MITRILLPLDGSQAAEMALPYAEELSRRLGTEIVLLHVLKPELRLAETEHRAYIDKIAESLSQPRTIVKTS